MHAFYRRSREDDGHHYYCISCVDGAARANGNKLTEHGFYRKTVYKLWANYRLTVDDFLRKVADQDQKCACCATGLLLYGREANWNVDHNHNTMKVRGILCSACNKGIGHFRDNISFIRAAAQYLEHYE